MQITGIDTNNPFYLRKAMLFDAYKINTELKKGFELIWNEVFEAYSLNAQRVMDKKARRHACNNILANLWKAYFLTFNPWVGYSRNKNHYAKGKRLRELHFKYESFIQTFNLLESLGYITNKDHVNFPGYSFSSRMKASPKLISFFQQHTKSNNRVELIGVKSHQDLVVLKDDNKNPIKYRSNKEVLQWRSNLERINKRLSETRIALEMDDNLYQRLAERLNQQRDRVDFFPDFTRTSLHRVFNNSSFKQGGRFYGGWWQSIPREFRKYITINHKPTEEVDYSGHHLRILYAKEEKELTKYPYEVDDDSRNTEELIKDRKDATLIMLNCNNSIKALNTIESEGIKQAQFIMDEIIERHDPIKDQFFTGIGNSLMKEDSIIAEEVMLEMLKLNHIVLPVHDSFIVRNSATFELKPIMEKAFTKFYKNNKTILKTKDTIFDIPGRNKHLRNEEGYITSDLQLLYEDTTIVSSLWGN